MAKGNENFLHLRQAYIFPWIEEKITEKTREIPGLRLYNLGIGDIALPLAPSIASAVQEGIEAMVRGPVLYGYGPSQGYLFLREAIRSNAYEGLPISEEEIFISDGINTDIVNILDLFDRSCRIAIPDPGYPAYLGSNILEGRPLPPVFMPCTEETGFVPLPPSDRCDLVYLCSPHNPTGTAMNRERLSAFIRYAEENDAILLFDGAYEAFISSPDVPKSIYEIPGALERAIEFRSFSKSAGFTGLRCSYTVIPREVKARFDNRSLPLLPFWKKRQDIKSNGVSYPIQRGAAACFSSPGKEEIAAQVSSYLARAREIGNALTLSGQTYYGGVDSPYLWWKAPEGLSSQEFFSLLLDKYGLVSIPGTGFGPSGEGYVRLSAFITEETGKEVINAITRSEMLHEV